MIFTEAPLSGAYVIDPEAIRDDRGFFARTYCDDAFAAAGLPTDWPQENLSSNTARHTLRGMHFNRDDFSEQKVVQASAGAIYDVIVDLREGSATRFDWFAIELTASNRRMLFVPNGFAHGFLTLEPNTDVRYRMSRRYEPAAADGLRWNDPNLGVEWPARPRVINNRDATYQYISDRSDELP